MNGNRIWAIGTVVVMIAVFALGWTLGLSPLLAQASASDAERETVAAQNEIEAAKLVEMRALYDNIDEIEYDLAQIRVSMPAEVDHDFIYGLLAGIQQGTGAT